MKYLTILVLGLFIFTHCKKEKMEFSPVGIGGDFELKDVKGVDFSLKANRGKPFLLFFGYTHCPDFCPMTLQKIRKVYEMKQWKSFPEVLFFTLDPWKETDQDLITYLEFYHIPYRGFRSPKNEDVLKLYGGQFEKKGEIIDHSTYLYLIHPSGEVVFLFKKSSTPEEIQKVLENLPEESN
jgi:protein SCO1/2